MKTRTKTNLAAAIYERVKQDIFNFALLPGERFTENETASKMGASRTPVREALTRLQQEGYIEVSLGSGWYVKPFDFKLYEDLYDIRTIIEMEAVRRLCAMDPAPDLSELKAIWLVPKEERIDHGEKVAALDEQFHRHLVAATGNREMSRLYNEITERIRILRRLDFTQPERVRTTYDEHAKILRTLLRRQTDHACTLIRCHIDVSREEVKKITIHRLHAAGQQAREQRAR